MSGKDFKSQLAFELASENVVENMKYQRWNQKEMRANIQKTSMSPFCS